MESTDVVHSIQLYNRRSRGGDGPAADLLVAESLRWDLPPAALKAEEEWKPSRLILLATAAGCNFIGHVNEKGNGSHGFS
ncbi:hypothetical protein E2562_002280 [Oryza meyeriana var. granulata]|uniref:Uncharacterized protein n=1 Tax=Oryza meyeriana var. granulata TaxID=110450 RepID=A0A6G1BHM4_9ORYZ|nr:hypothetical protein E2562_002280 [Oryza meyeriana var. granulata]